MAWAVEGTWWFGISAHKTSTLLFSFASTIAKNCLHSEFWYIAAEIACLCGIPSIDRKELPDLHSVRYRVPWATSASELFLCFHVIVMDVTNLQVCQFHVVWTIVDILVALCFAVGLCQIKLPRSFALRVI